MNHVATAFALLGLSLGGAGCSATESVARRSPSVAFGASVSDVGAPSCTMKGVPRIVATHVAPRGGVTAVAEDGRVWLRYGTKHGRRAAIAIDPTSLDEIDGDGAPIEMPADASRGRVEVDLGEGRRLAAWTEGSLYAGLDVKAAVVAVDGTTEAPVDLGYQGSAIGRPAVAVTSAGEGVVAFLESNGAGFQLVATRVSCGAP